MQIELDSGFDFTKDLSSKQTIDKFFPYFKDAILDINRLEPIRIIGEGAFAIVYKCRDKTTQELVAVKVLKKNHLSRAQDVYDFLLEAKTLSKLNHPSIVKFKGICFGQLSIDYAFESICVVTEFMEGGSLKEWIRANERRQDKAFYTKRQALKWMIQIARGVEYLHSRENPILHRDLKPENILLIPSESTSRGYDAKIADFGLSIVIDKSKPLLEEVVSPARPKTEEELKAAMAGISDLITAGSAKNEEDKHVKRGSTRFLLTGKIGSYLYMAPEVLRGEEYNAKVDVFSFATIVYEVLSGVRIVSTLGPNHSMADVQKFASEVRDGRRLPLTYKWPEEVETLISECWQDNSSNRPSMEAVASRLESMLKKGIFSTKTKSKMRKYLKAPKKAVSIISHKVAKKISEMHS